MKCKNCGGELRLANGIAVCQACSTSYTLDSFFEDADVHICYIENDANGRRTKDSILAQEVYRQLETRKISAFYERISADNVAGDDLEKIRLNSIQQAKIILVVGTSVNRFTAIWEKFGEHFAGKTVIPVCADVKPNEIPRELSKIQALDCGSIGWEKDLERGILRLLGREKEIDLLDVHQKAQKSRAVLIGLGVAVILVVLAMILFALPEKEEPSVVVPTEQTEIMATEPTMPLTNQQIYENAQSLVNEGKYLEAINTYSQIPEFKDSQNQIKSIFNFYDGYYQDETQGSSLYINIIDGTMAELTFDKIVDGKLVRIEETIFMENNQINGKYVDNLSNEGDISITLYNDKVELNISTEDVAGEVSAGSVSIEFSLESKEDRPPIKEVTKEILLEWLSTPTTVDDIRVAGYDLTYVYSEIDEDYPMFFGTQYEIANSGITIITTNIDLEKGPYKDFDFSLRDDYIVVAAIVPATVMCPEKIGDSSNAFTENDVVYAPGAYNLAGITTFMGGDLNFWVSESDDPMLESVTITEDTTVGIASKEMVGAYYYQKLIKTHKEIYESTVWFEKMEEANSAMSEYSQSDVAYL